MQGNLGKVSLGVTGTCYTSWHGSVVVCSTWWESKDSLGFIFHYCLPSSASMRNAQKNPGPSTGSSTGPRNDFTSRNLGTGRPTIQCTAYGEYSHWRRECPYNNYCMTCNNYDHATHMWRAHRQTNDRSQQGQQSPLICAYCGSIEHSSSNCHRRPWNNREQPCSTPNSLRRTSHPILKIQEILDQTTDIHCLPKNTNYNYDYRELQRQPHARFDERYNQRYSPPVFPPTPSLNSFFSRRSK